MTDDLLLLPLRDVLTNISRAAAPGAAGASRITIDVLAPPRAAAGTGALRVVRVLETDGAIALTAAYDGYVRL